MDQPGKHESVLLTPDYLRECGKRIAGYVLAVSTLQIACLFALRRHVPGSKGKSPDEALASRKSYVEPGSEDTVLLNSFQLTNFFINLCLGSSGIWWWFFVLSSDCSDSDKMGDPFATETPECFSPPFFSEFQVAYQIWSIPLCIAVGESAAMLSHHSFVAVLAILGSNVVTNPRYFSVFFFGVVETSSIFLAVMNAFKSRPEWIEAMPGPFAVCKLLFSATFLLTRIVLWMPILYDFWGIAWDILTSHGEDNPLYHVLLLAFFAPAAFLTFLQLFWAGKIVRGLAKMITRPASSGCVSGMSTKVEGKAHKS